MKSYYKKEIKSVQQPTHTPSNTEATTLWNESLKVMKCLELRSAKHTWASTGKH